MMWVFWVLVCVVLFMLMWPAFEQDLPPELRPFASQRAVKAAPVAAPPATPTSPITGLAPFEVSGWYVQPTVGGWLMSRSAQAGFTSPDSVYREPPLLYSSCSGHTWVEARAAIDLRPHEELVVRARIGEARWEFNASSVRLISANPGELNLALERLETPQTLLIKVPYREYGTPEVSFELTGFKAARDAMFSACERVGGLPNPAQPGTP